MSPETAPAWTGPLTRPLPAGDDPTAGATRRRIIDVALELFAEKGFDATSTRELAERLGFTKAALYYHFRSKDDLLEALVEPGLTELRSLVGEAAATPNRSKRRRLLSGYVDLVLRNRRLTQLMSQDPSLAQRSAFAAALPLFVRLTELLAGADEPGPAERARVRSALGGIHAALLHGRAEDPLEVLRAAALSSACGALGIPGPVGNAAE